MGKSFLQEAWDEGEQAGIAVGEQEGKVEVAQRLVQERVDEALISRVTGLSNAEIDALRHSLNGHRH